MTLESALITGIGAVTAALVAVVKLLWARSVKCEEQHDLAREQIAQLKEAVGLAEGSNLAFQKCPEPRCPFKAPSPTLTPIPMTSIAATIVAITALFLSGCSNVSPAQQANVDKAVAVGLDLATKALEKQLETSGFTKDQLAPLAAPKK